MTFMLLLQLLKWCLEAAEVLVAISIAYLCILVTTVLLHGRKSKMVPADQSFESARINFAILIPAHNEEVLLGSLLKSLSTLAYPKELYSVYVIADNCTDKTAEVGRAAGWVQVYERFDQDKRSKGYALEWMLQRLKEDQRLHDAYVIFDADSIVEPNFLQAMAKELAQGQEALQGSNEVLNATEAPSTILRWVSMTLINHVRPLGRSLLGFSSRLTGNGMCLSHDLLERFPWSTHGHSEDYEYYLMLVRQGKKVRYVPDAIVRSHMPPTFAEMRTQDIRWETGSAFSVKIKKALLLLRAGLRLRTVTCFEAIVELLIPPLSLLISWCVALFVASLLFWSPSAIILSLLILSGLAYYIGSAFYVLHPEPAVYKALLLYAPRFVLWKLWVLLVLRWSKKHKSEWIRTSRPTLPTEI